MSNAAVVHLFPAVTAESLASEYLAAKRDAEAAKARMDAVAADLAAILQEEGRKGVSVAGLGRVSLVVTAPSARVDQRACVAALQAAGLEVPMVPTAGGTSLRASLD